LNMRLRALRKLEEMEIRREYQELSDERDDLIGLLDNEGRQWRVIGKQLEQLCAVYGPDTPLGKRRTTFEDAPETDDVDLAQAMIEREPITVVLSQKGWIRALKGHLDDVSHVTFKGDDRLHLAFKAETTDKIVVFATNGKFFTVPADRLPGGRGFGEPLRLIIDIEAGVDVVTAFVHAPERRLLVATTSGHGFVAKESDVVANTRKGKQVLNVKLPDEAKVCVPAVGDRVAVVGENRKLLVFSLDELPEMARGKGVRLQRYKDGGLSDIRCFTAADGLTWVDSSGRTWTVEDFAEWAGQRAQAGRLPPKGFPRSNSFGPVVFAKP
ncbi:MAG: DNA topoisomerase IV subunit A, partial [Rhodobiaceae bacterium]|nr:DNA topoisomerase IV subunit A [Rhodobiaceae bacterium]